MSGEPSQILEPEELLESRLTAAKLEEDLNKASVPEVIANPSYLALKAGLDALVGHETSEVEVDTFDALELTFDPPAVCRFETNIESDGSVIEVDFTREGVRIATFDKYKQVVPYKDVDEEEILTFVYDAAIKEEMISLDGAEPTIPEKPHWANSPFAKTAALLLAVGLGIGGAVEMVLGAIDEDKGNNKTAQVIADEFTSGQPHHTRSENVVLYTAGEKQHQHGTNEGVLGLFCLIGAAYLPVFRRKLAEQGPT